MDKTKDFHITLSTPHLSVLSQAIVFISLCLNGDLENCHFDQMIKSLGKNFQVMNDIMMALMKLSIDKDIKLHKINFPDYDPESLKKIDTDIENFFKSINFKRCAICAIELN